MRMPKQLLDGPHIGAFVQQVGGKRMAQYMGADMYGQCGLLNKAV